MSGLRKKYKQAIPPQLLTLWHHTHTSRLKRIVGMLNDVNVRLDTLERIEMDSRHDAAVQYEQLTDRVRSMDTRTSAYLNMLYMRGVDDSHAAAIDLFASIPAKKGIGRQYQLALSKLMHVLDRLCHDNGLRYFLYGGGLLAALTRHSSIPWDDDIDIWMPRTDLEALRTLLADDPTYQVSLVYDHIVYSKQYRFATRDASNPCFIDIAPMDWAASNSPEHDEQLKQLRRDLEADLKAHDAEFPLWQQYTWLFLPGGSEVMQTGEAHYAEQNLQANAREAQRIEAIFEKYQQRALDMGVICTDPDSPYMTYGLELLMDVPDRTMIFPTDKIFPTQPIAYDGYVFQAPHDIDFMLDLAYENWPYIPENIYDHEHFSAQILQRPQVQQSLRELLK